MMQKVQCADGSRVKNIKEQFEVLSYEAAASETEIKFKCSSTQRLEKTSIRQNCSNNASSTIHEDETKGGKYSLKESALKHDKCSIKRTPAFRCDKIVKGKIVTGQNKEKHKYVEDKVKLFEDGGIRMLEPTTERSQVVPETVIHKRSGEPNVSRSVVGSIVKNPDIPKRSYPKREVFSPTSRKISSEGKITNLNELQTNLGCNSSIKSTSGDVSPRKINRGTNRDIARDDIQIIPKSITSSVDNLKDILKSPLPPGPPPRKPPRTFAHCSRSATQLNTIQKCSRSVKEVTKEIVRTSADSVFPLPALVRSKTESQIELRNKLETVLAKLQSAENSPQSHPVDQNKKNSQPCKTRPTSKPDLSPSSLLVGCLSLGCVNSHQYEEVGAGRPFIAESSDRRESLDIRSSLIETAGKENKGSLLRSQSEDHIYAVPFSDVKDVFLPKRDVSLQSKSKDTKNDESSKRSKEANSTGLHYMCTPILTNESLHSFDTHEELSHAGGVHGPLRYGALGKVSPFFSIPNGKEFGYSSKINGKMNHMNGKAEITFHEDGKEVEQPSKAGEDGQNAESKSSHCGSSTDNEEELGEEEQDPVTKEIVEQRKGYVRRMCSIFNKIQLKAQENSSPLKGPMATVSFLGKNTPSAGPSLVKRSSLPAPDPMCENESSKHLFECVLLVGLTLSSGADKGKSYVPYIKSKFPANVLVPPLIEHLCFPDASDWTIRRLFSPKGSSEGSKKRDSKSDDEMMGDGCDQTYSLVITGADGSRRFGYCRRVLPEGGSMCLPLTYCLISPYRANGFYFKVLAELESRHGGPESEQSAFLQELYSCPLPGPSEVLQPPSSAEPLSPYVQSLRRPFDVRLEEKDVMELITCLEVGVFLDVFASILLERKILLISKYLSKLSYCVQALQSVLYPFTWQHTFIPVLPAPMFDICGAPTPYIIGILKGGNGQVPDITIDEGLMVDLDTSQCLNKVGDEGSILPSRMKRMLQSALRIISSMKNSQQNSNKKNAISGDDIAVCNLLVSEAFMGTFLFIVGHYPNHIVTHGDGHRKFQREKFIKAMPFSGVRMFLEWFTETAMFTAFINASLEGSGDSEFEKRAKKFCEESWKDSLLFLKAYKNFMKKNKTFG